MSKVSQPLQSSIKSQKIVVKNLRRIVDANLNRALEGLRVCEEFCRFVIEKKTLTSEAKKIRHLLIASLKNFCLTTEDLISARNIIKDVGKRTTKSERVRRNFRHIVLANLQRVKESLRVLEEYLKLDFNTECIKVIRYRFYEFERKVIAELIKI